MVHVLFLAVKRLTFFNRFDQVMCDAYTPAGEPIPTNKRHAAAEIFDNPDVVAEVPWLIQIPLFVFSYLFRFLAVVVDR